MTFYLSDIDPSDQRPGWRQARLSPHRYAHKVVSSPRDPDHIESLRQHRDPCPRCGVRADLHDAHGCGRRL